MNLFIVGIGGAIGSIVRYEIGKMVSKNSKFKIPVGTIIVNITGALLLGIVSRLSKSEVFYLFFAEGFLGAYTTFSTFMYEGFHIIKNNEILNVLIYIVGTIILGLVFFILGYYIL